MKNYTIIRIIIPVFFLYMWSCQPEEEHILEMDSLEQEVENFIFDAEEKNVLFNQRIPEDITTCSNAPIEVPLIGWPGIEMGTFNIDNNDEYLIVHFELDPNSGWYFTRTRLLVVMTRENSVTSKQSISILKKYIYPVYHEKGTMSFTYRIPLSDLKAGYTDNETCIYLAGIARLNNGKYRYGKFAIAQDNNRNGKYFWKSWLHKYCIAECIESVNSDCGTFDCATAWMEGTEYFYGETETGFYTSLPSELNNKYAILAVIDPVCGKRIEVGKVEIMFWGASSQYDLFIEFQPYDGYDIQDARIYAGILEPLREPDTFKNHITFADQNTLVFKMKTDYEPVFISITATVCTENNSLSVLNEDD